MTAHAQTHTHTLCFDDDITSLLSVSFYYWSPCVAVAAVCVRVCKDLARTRVPKIGTGVLKKTRFVLCFDFVFVARRPSACSGSSVVNCCCSAQHSSRVFNLFFFFLFVDTNRNVGANISERSFFVIFFLSNPPRCWEPSATRIRLEQKNDKRRRKVFYSTLILFVDEDNQTILTAILSS